MKLCSITPRAGGFELRVYEVGHAADSEHSRSLGVTRPPVASLILNIIEADGVLVPLRYRQIVSPVTPTVSPKAVCEMPCSERNSASVMSPIYQAGRKLQLISTAWVEDLSCHQLYHMGMMTELKRLRLERKATDDTWTTVWVGKEVGLKDSNITRFETGERIPTDLVAVRLANLFEVSPFQIKPTFGQDSVAGLPPDRRAARLADLKADYENEVLRVAYEKATAAAPVAVELRERAPRIGKGGRNRAKA